MKTPRLPWLRLVVLSASLLVLASVPTAIAQNESRQSNDQRPLKCSQRQDQFAAKAAQAQATQRAQLVLIDATVNRLQQYVDKHDLEPANFNELLDAASSSRRAAEAALNDTTAPQLNCDNQTARSQVAELRVKVATTSSALKAYRLNATNLLSAAMQAPQGASR